MTADNEGSVTGWIAGVQESAGSRADAARQLWERYFDRLARLAHAQLRAAPRGPADGEDVALSVFDSFFRGASEGKFPHLSGRDDLWKLLVTLAARKASNQRRSETVAKRGGGRVVAGTDLDAAVGGADVLAQTVGAEPSPELAAIMADEVRRRFNALPDKTLRLVAMLRLEGYSNEEIAAALRCSLRSVERKLTLIREAWSEEATP